MSEDKKQVYRLFKVAKELNVGSATIVEHLTAKGFEIKNSPNEKLSEDMYSVLLRDFASEKVQKEKATQIKEQKKEQKAVKEDSATEEEEILTAEQLRSGFYGKKGPVREKEESAVKKVAEKKASVVVNPPVVPEKEPVKEEPPVIEEKTPEIEKEPVVVVEPVVEKTPEVISAEVPVVEAEKEKKTEVTGLKIIGKIDLNKDKSSFRGKKQEKKETPVTPKAEEKTVVVEAPEVRKEKEKEETPPVVEAPPVVEPKEEEKSEVIRASDHSPKLSGLKVMGRIELPTDKQKGRKVETAGGAGADGDKKKRRRKRKKSAAVPETKGPADNRGGNRGGQQNQGGRGKPPVTQDRRPKKEAPTDKEIQDKIRSTLAELDKRAGRSRQRMRRAKRDEHATRSEAELLRRQAAEKVLEVTEFITANDLASLMNVSVTEVISKCMELGYFVSINQRLEADIIAIIAEEFGFVATFAKVQETDLEEEEDDGAPEGQRPRAPIITVMGHVDHGKTSLLDYLRKTSVVAGEAGGITQHIGAYEVQLKDGRKITFLDTPGHEAFTAMRARGAKITDVVIIVVAADDNVMPQTKEAINHAQAAGVPMVFAINKVDKPTSNPEKIREQLAQMNILVEDWGGKYSAQNISAKQGTGVEELLEKVMLEADMLELKANPDAPARGAVIEARLDKGRGVVATFLVQNGTLRVGDSLVAGIHFGKVKALTDERGNRIQEAGPSTPVQVLGLPGVPTAGDAFRSYKDERRAKEIAQRRNELFREQALRASKHLTLEEIARRKAIGDFKELNIIVKGDVDGSVEALSDSLLKLGNEELKVNIIMKGVGQISESDVLLASASDAIIIGFQVRPSPSARKLAETEAIDMRLYRIIYDAINDVRDALEGMLSPEIREEVTASVEIREVFKISKSGNVAGCMVVDGKISRSDNVRLVRDGIVVYEGKLGTLKRFKDDVKEVAQGFECGLTVENYNDIRPGDVVEAYKSVESKRSL